MNGRSPENDIDSYPHWDVDRWTPDLPPGRVERLYVHWSAHDYQSVFPAYHFCIATAPDGRLIVVNTHDVRENMRDVAEQPQRPYAAHTRGRNAFALGISIMAMENATPTDFGRFALTQPLIDGLCRVTSLLASFYDVPIDAENIMLHAEAALRDGYFGTAPEERWDIARLAADDRPLLSHHAADVGDELRSRMRLFRDGG